MNIKSGDLYQSIKYGFMYVILNKRNVDETYNVYDVSDRKIRWERTANLSNSNIYRKLA